MLTRLGRQVVLSLPVNLSVKHMHVGVNKLCGMVQEFPDSRALFFIYHISSKVV